MSLTWRGLLKPRLTPQSANPMRRTTERFRDCVLGSFGRFLGWNPQKMCFCVKEKYTLKRVLERKYKVRL